MNRSFLKNICLVIVCVFGIFVLHYTRVIREGENEIRNMNMPFLQFFVPLKVSFLHTFFPPQKQETNESLHKKINELLTEQAQLKLRLAEDETLRKQLDFLKTHTYSYRVAHVIGKNLNSQQSSILIDKGVRDGVKEGMPVIVDNGVLIGKISRAEDTISHVLLLNDTKSKIVSSLLSKNTVSGIVQGNFSLGLIFTLIPINELIHEQDLVATSGLEKGIPPGLVIGTISSFEKKPTDLFQSAIVSPLVDYNSMSVATVLIEENP